MANGHQVEHVVVLMLENRSFDHMFGWITGALNGTQSNWLDPNTPSLGTVNVTPNASYEGLLDPGHEFADVEEQLTAPSPKAPTNGGFATNYRAKLAAAGMASAKVPDVMAGFALGRLPVLERLAAEFAICTAWYSSVPGPTWPNRFFAQAAQSGGRLDNRPVYLPNIFEALADAKVSSKIYFHDIPQALANLNLVRSWMSGSPYFGVSRYTAFKTDVDAGRLPQYSFIEPQYFEVGDFKEWWKKFLYRLFGFKGTKASDQHPPHDVKMGEWLIKDIYDTLRKSGREYWRNTMFVVTWDEHGGLYDTEDPPTCTPPFAGQLSPEGFQFDRLGVRVPAVIVSPCIERGAVDTTKYDHSSICATLERLFKVGSLTDRDAAANPIVGIDCTGAVRNWPALKGPGFTWLTGTKGPAGVVPSDLQRHLHELALDLVAEAEGVRTEPTTPGGAALRAEGTPQEAEGEAPADEQVLRAQVGDMMNYLFDQ